MVRYRVPPALAMAAAALCSCAKRDVAVVDVKGECGDVFKAQICTWARTQGTTVVAVGADVPVSSIENAPAAAPMGWPPAAEARLKLPEAAQAQSGLTLLTVYWEPMGHPPGPYLTPHFDFHFYRIAPEEQAAIDCKDTAKPPTLAAGYALPDVTLPPPMAKMTGVATLVGICVPLMGMHSLPAAELASTNLFRGTMVLGYYHSKPVFVEPMLTREMLMEKHSFDLPIATIPGLAGAYPRTFHADYDADKQVYHFVFSGFAPGS